MELLHGRLLVGCLTLAILVVPTLRSQTKAQTKAEISSDRSKAPPSAAALAPLTVPVVNELRGLAPGRYPLKDSAGALLGEFTINGNGTMDVGKLFAQKAGGGDTACGGSQSDDEERRKLLEEIEKAIKEINRPRPSPPKSKSKGNTAIRDLLRAYCGAALRAPSPGAGTTQGFQK